MDYSGSEEGTYIYLSTKSSTKTSNFSQTIVMSYCDGFGARANPEIHENTEFIQM